MQRSTASKVGEQFLGPDNQGGPSRGLRERGLAGAEGQLAGQEVPHSPFTGCACHAPNPTGNQGIWSGPGLAEKAQPGSPSGPWGQESQGSGEKAGPVCQG